MWRQFGLLTACALAGCSSVDLSPEAVDSWRQSSIQQRYAQRTTHPRKQSAVGQAVFDQKGRIETSDRSATILPVAYQDPQVAPPPAEAETNPQLPDPQPPRPGNPSQDPKQDDEQKYQSVPPPKIDYDAIRSPALGAREVGLAPGQPLLLGMVHDSILSSYPLIEAALQERYIAYGSLVESRGSFDTKIKAEAMEEPIGFYRNYRQMIGVEHPLDNGGDVFAGYRIGRGLFEPWYKERETDEAGEFKVGFDLPLLQNDDIDERRAKFFKANLGVYAAEPEIRSQVIEFMQFGSFIYWEWVATGAKVRVARDLLQNAEVRQDGLRERVAEGDLGEIALVDNNRLIASRQAKLIDAERKFRQVGVKLSLFLRDASGAPIIPGDSHLPPDFPTAISNAADDIMNDVNLAWANRPELRALDLKREQLQVELAQALNLQLPELNWVATMSQDVGNPASKKRDKHRLEVDTGVRFSVPIQRRKAIGKQAQVEGKLAQLNAKARFTREKIAAEVQATAVELRAAEQLIEQARQGLELARKMEQAERDKFDEGDSDLLLVNLREKATADAAADLVEAQLQFFLAEVQYQAVLGLLAPPEGFTPFEP